MAATAPNSVPVKNPTFSNKKYDYVRTFETDDRLMPQCYVVCRVDGKNFHKFTSLHNFDKPNDLRALKLMNQAAVSVMEATKDITLAYGQSDEFSFVFPRHTKYVSRRSSKIISHVVSAFSSAYTYYWPRYFGSAHVPSPNVRSICEAEVGMPPAMSNSHAPVPEGEGPAKEFVPVREEPLRQLPAFDGRTVAYPNLKCLRDYISWRQVDCHVNNLYNTAFWSLVLKDGLSQTQAQELLKGTLSGDKNEILYSKFGMNYNDEAQIYRKGSLIIKPTLLNSKYLASLYRPDSKIRGSGKGKKFDFYHDFYYDLSASDVPCNDLNNFNGDNEINGMANGNMGNKKTSPYIALSLDLIGDEFWERNPDIFGENS